MPSFERSFWVVIEMDTANYHLVMDIFTVKMNWFVFLFLSVGVLAHPHPSIRMATITSNIDNTCHTNPVVSPETIQFVCVSEFTNFGNIYPNYTWCLNGRPFRMIFSRVPSMCRKSCWILLLHGEIYLCVNKPLQGWPTYTRLWTPWFT